MPELGVRLGGSGRCSSAPPMKPPVLALKDVRLADGPHDAVRRRRPGRRAARRAPAWSAATARASRPCSRSWPARSPPDGGERTVQPGDPHRLSCRRSRTSSARPCCDYVIAGEAEPHRGRGGAGALRPRSGARRPRACRAARSAAPPWRAPSPRSRTSSCSTSRPTTSTSWPSRRWRTELAAIALARLLIVSHDRAFLERVTHRCFWLEHRKVRTPRQGLRRLRRLGRQASRPPRPRKAAGSISSSSSEDLLAAPRRSPPAAPATRAAARALMELRQHQGRAPARAVAAGCRMGLDCGGLSGQRVAEVKSVSKAFGDRSLVQGLLHPHPARRPRGHRRPATARARPPWSSCCWASSRPTPAR